MRNSKTEALRGGGSGGGGGVKVLSGMHFRRTGLLHCCLLPRRASIRFGTGGGCRIDDHIISDWLTPLAAAAACPSAQLGGSITRERERALWAALVARATGLSCPVVMAVRLNGCSQCGVWI